MTPVTPLTYYQQALDSGRLQPDTQQSPVVEKLESIYQALRQRDKEKKHLLSKFKSKPPIIGLYLWGSVGIGKTFLMDCFYQCLHIKKNAQSFSSIHATHSQGPKRDSRKKEPASIYC